MECQLLYPQTVACSGHGECNTTTGECECDAGWISVGDFALTIGADCDINVKAVQALWGIAIVVAAAVLQISMNYFYRKFLYHRSAFENKSMMQLAMDPMIMFPLCDLIYSVAAIIVGLLRAIFVGERVIGGDFAVSFFWFLELTFIMLGGAGMIKAFSNFLASYLLLMSDSARERLMLEGMVVQRILPFVMVAVAIVTAMTIPIVWYPNLLPIFSGIHFIGFGVLLALIGYLNLVKTMTPVIREVQKHVNDALEPDSGIPKESMDQITSILRKLKIARMVSGQAVLSVLIALVLFGCWPYLLRKSSYFCPIATIFASITAWVSVRSVNNFSSSSSSSQYKKGGSTPDDRTSSGKLSPITSAGINAEAPTNEDPKTINLSAEM